MSGPIEPNPSGQIVLVGGSTEPMGHCTGVEIDQHVWAFMAL